MQKGEGEGEGEEKYFDIREKKQPQKIIDFMADFYDYFMWLTFLCGAYNKLS